MAAIDEGRETRQIFRPKSYRRMLTVFGTIVLYLIVVGAYGFFGNRDLLTVVFGFAVLVAVAMAIDLALLKLVASVEIAGDRILVRSPLGIRRAFSRSDVRRLIKVTATNVRGGRIKEIMAVGPENNVLFKLNGGYDADAIAVALRVPAVGHWEDQDWNELDEHYQGFSPDWWAGIYFIGCLVVLVASAVIVAMRLFGH